MLAAGGQQAGKLLQLFGKTHLAKGTATAYTTTMGGKIKIGYEVMIGGMDSSDGSRQGRADIQRMLMTAGGISGRLLAMFLDTQDWRKSITAHGHNKRRNQ